MGQKSDARERLLQVAFELIWQQSYGSVSVDNICKRAAVKKGSFYYFFPSKCDLTVAAYEEHWQQRRLVYDRAFSPMVPPLERIENYCNGIYEGQKEKLKKAGRVLGCPFSSVACELSTQDEKIRLKSEEIFERGCKYIEQALQDAQRDGLIERYNAAKKARAISSFIIGMLLSAKVKNDVEVLRDLAPNVMQLVGVPLPV